MKVLLFNGSTRNNGCTYLALDQVAQTLRQAGIETELLQLGSKPVRDCLGCNRCAENGQCVFSEDVVNLWIRKARQADGFVFGSPVYFAHPTGQMLAVMDRLFYAEGMPLPTNLPPQWSPPAGRYHCLPRCAHQALHQCPNAGGVLHLLEHGIRPCPRAGRSGPRGPAKPCGTWGETSPGSSNASRQDGSKVFCPRKLSTAINPSACARFRGSPASFFPSMQRSMHCLQGHGMLRFLWGAKGFASTLDTF